MQKEEVMNAVIDLPLLVVNEMSEMIAQEIDLPTAVHRKCHNGRALFSLLMKYLGHHLLPILA